MELRNLHLPLACFSNGGSVILKSIVPTHPFRDGKRITEEIIGRSVTVVFPENGYDTLTVKVSDPTDALAPLLARATAKNPVLVDFVDFDATIYTMRGSDGQFRTGISAKASKVNVVSSDLDEIMDV